MIQFNLRLNHWKQIPYSFQGQTITDIYHSHHCLSFRYLGGTQGNSSPLTPTTSWHVSSHLICLSSLLFPAVNVHHFNIVLQKYNVSRGFLQLLGQVSYGDIDHWMWRLYLDDFGEFCDSIGLPVCPYAELRPDDPLPPPTTLLYGISPRVIEKPQYWPER